MTLHTTMAHIATALPAPAPVKALLLRLWPPVVEPQPPVHVSVLPQRLDTAGKKEAAEVFLASLHAGIGYLHLEISSVGGRITYGLRCRPDTQTYVQGQLAAQYPGVQFRTASEDLPASSPSYSTCLELALPDAIPLRCFDSFASDPLAPLLTALSVVPAAESVRIALLIERIPDTWQKPIRSYASALRAGKEPPGNAWTWLLRGIVHELAGLAAGTVQTALGHNSHTAPVDRETASHADQPQLDLVAAIEEKALWAGFRTVIRLDVWATSQPAAQERVKAIEAALHNFSLPHLNGFVARPLKDDTRLTEQALLEQRGFVLSIPELAGLWHLPGSECSVAGITWAYTRQAEPPVGDCIVLGQTAFRCDQRPFGLLENDRFRHLYVIGKAGGGKSTLLKNLIIQDMQQGYGLALLDPHGDLYDDLLDYVPAPRVKDVVLLDPGDQDYPVSLNPLELPDPTQKAQVASALVDILKRSFEHSWGPRLEYILRNCILTLLEIPNSTIMGIPRLLSDEGYRAWVLARIQDPVMRFFWEREFAGMLSNPRLVTEAISPVQNKVGQFVAAPLLRHVLAQARSTINMQDIMDTSKILLVNLSKGRIGEDSSSLLGAMIISSLHFAAMRRVTQPENERRPFFLYADEFQSFATSTFASILSEARKYRLGLILAHQYISQLPDDVREAVFGNVGSLVAFTVGPDDARFLEREFAPGFSAGDLVNLERYRMAVRLMVEGSVTPSFSATGMPPYVEKTGLRERVIASSRGQYAREVAVVEKRIRTWSERIYHAPRWAGDISAKSGGPRGVLPRFPLVGQEGKEDEGNTEAPATDQMGDSGE